MKSESERNSYKVEEFGTTVDFIGNPHLFKNSDEMNAAMATWPFQPAKPINNLPEPPKAG